MAVLVIVNMSVDCSGGKPATRPLLHFGVWAGIVSAGLYAAVNLAPLPAAVSTLAAGATFGVTVGAVIPNRDVTRAKAGWSR